MTANVTVQTSASTSVLVPFSSAANAALIQGVLDGGFKSPNNLASLGITQYYSPPNVSGNVTLPGAGPIGGVVDTVPATLNFGVMDPAYTMLVNAGSGTVIAVGGAHTTLVSGANATSIYMNQSTDGLAYAYIGGGSAALSNAFSTSKLNVVLDGPGGTALGVSAVVIDDSAGGSMNVLAHGGVLIGLESGGSDSIMAQGGTVAILAHQGSSSLGGITTISAADSSTDVWVGAGGAPIFINPGAGNAFVFQTGGSENSATLFGGTRVINGATVTAADFTGRASVAGVNGYLESGSAGGSVMSTGTTAGAATLVAGGSNDHLFLYGLHDTAYMGNGTNVTMSAAGISVGGGVNVFFGAGSGMAYGATDGSNVFTFTGAGNYTVVGSHDFSSPSITGSLYRDAAGVGGAGTITIQDFLPKQFDGQVHDRFDLGSSSVVSISSTDMGGGLTNSVVQLSDGTTVNFNNLISTIQVQGTFIV